EGFAVAGIDQVHSRGPPVELTTGKLTEGGTGVPGNLDPGRAIRCGGLRRIERGPERCWITSVSRGNPDRDDGAGGQAGERHRVPWCRLRGAHLAEWRAVSDHCRPRAGQPPLHLRARLGDVTDDRILEIEGVVRGGYFRGGRCQEAEGVGAAWTAGVVDGEQ